MVFSSGRIAHPSDIFIRNVALVSLTILGALLLYDRISTTSKTQGGPSVSCWFPDRFTSSMVATGTQICSMKKHQYPAGDTNLQPTHQTEIKPPDFYPSTLEFKNLLFKSVTVLEILVTAQIGLTVVAFLMLRNVACRAATQARILAAGIGGTALQLEAAKGLRRAFCTSITYILIQVGYLISMIVMVGHLRSLPSTLMVITPEELTEPLSKEFLCDFSIPRLGNMQRYTVHCVSNSAPVLAGDAGISGLVLYLDTVLCGSLAVMLAAHLLQTFLLNSAASDVIAAYDIEKPLSFGQKLIFGCTDMNLAAIFLNNMGHPHVLLVNGQNGNRGFSAPLYSKEDV